MAGGLRAPPGAGCRSHVLSAVGTAACRPGPIAISCHARVGRRQKPRGCINEGQTETPRLREQVKKKFRTYKFDKLDKWKLSFMILCNFILNGWVSAVNIRYTRQNLRFFRFSNVYVDNFLFAHVNGLEKTASQYYYEQK